MRVLVCLEDLDTCPPESVATVNLGEMFDPALIGITPAGALKAYSFGLGAVLLFWGIGYGISLAVGSIRKL